jgi:HSP20 family protein
MTQLVKWSAFPEMRTLRERMLSLFDNNLSGRDEELSFYPAVNVTETETEYKIKAELPGMKKENVKVTLENGLLTLSGERRQEHEEKNARYHVYESSYGKFSRSFNLPGDTDPNKVNAEFADGVLDISVAKGESSKPKQITIK